MRVPLGVPLMEGVRVTLFEDVAVKVPEGVELALGDVV